MVIDKGSRDGVYDGQPVISDKGVVGQVIAVSQLTSRVLLICDTTHALPIQVLRNDIRVIASGTGCTDDLQLEPLPNNIDIRVGMCWSPPASAAVSGRLPVGIVSSVKVDNQRAYTIISAKPTADLQRLRYLLLLWGGDSNPREPSGPSEVYRAANERIMQVMPQVIPSVQTPETDRLRLRRKHLPLRHLPPVRLRRNRPGRSLHSQNRQTHRPLPHRPLRIRLLIPRRPGR